MCIHQSHWLKRTCLLMFFFPCSLFCPSGSRLVIIIIPLRLSPCHVLCLLSPYSLSWSSSFTSGLFPFPFSTLLWHYPFPYHHSPSPLSSLKFPPTPLLVLLPTLLLFRLFLLASSISCSSSTYFQFFTSSPSFSSSFPLIILQPGRPVL